MATCNLHLHLVFPMAQPMTCPPRAKSLTRTRTVFPSLLTTRAAGPDVNSFLGDFGARDPFPAELESSFGEKVVGYGNTEHKILIPNISALSLSQQECAPISPVQSPISLDDAQALVRKVTTFHHYKLPNA